MELGIHARVRTASAAQGARRDPKLLPSVKFNIRRSYGTVDYVGFRFARQGVYIEHGVGRGRPRGSAQAEAAKKQWISIVLPPRMEVLAEMLATEYADIAAAELRILVPGLIDTKISR